MNKSILYMGDTSIEQQASYLAGVMTHYNIEFDYIDSATPLNPDFAKKPYAAVIISDYPAANFSPDATNTLIKKVTDGMGLLMIGGWESFNGFGSQYYNTPIANLLPVILRENDDRFNCSSPCLVEKIADHPILENLPFDTNAPCIGGYNRFTAKPGTSVILRSRIFTAQKQNNSFTFSDTAKTDPLLVLGNYNKSRTAALATDAAPHWVGPLVDWGDKRISACAKNSEQIEVGNWYAQLYANLVKYIVA
jgi:uncharacterized membrane protein